LPLGLPSRIAACLFDLDGVLTRTSVLHAEAWKRAFDEYLRARAAARSEPFVPFDAVRDYVEHVDGKPRDDGVRSFLAARGIHLPEGAEARHLAGKPAPDTFLAAAEALAVEPARPSVFEDALAGVEAGRAGHFGHVVGVDRVGQAAALRCHGADVVVPDLGILLGAS
jgi:beta-phosphoglucomutase-like phosphatase (HAD superfamily)